MNLDPIITSILPLAVTYKDGDEVQVNHPTIKMILITKSQSGAVAGWLNDSTVAANFFSLYYLPAQGSWKGGWMANLGTTWKNRMDGETLAKLLNMQRTFA